MKKGISAVLATVLIVVITVAIIGLAYTWSVGMFDTVSDTSGEQLGGITDKMEKSVKIQAAGCGDGNITFTVQNTGTKNIVDTELTAFLDESLATTDPEMGALNVGQSLEFNISGTYESGTEYTLKVDAPARAVEETVTC